jgi:hypothetical protein
MIDVTSHVSGRISVSGMSATVAAVWLTVAILGGGYARDRGRSGWTWFLLTLILGPVAALLLVTWPRRD